jgi:hypothetical protein
MSLDDFNGSFVMPSPLIIPSPSAQALSMFQSILLSLGQSINHDNVLYISNYYINTKEPEELVPESHTNGAATYSNIALCLWTTLMVVLSCLHTNSIGILSG